MAELSKHRCPRCGAEVVVGKVYVWCSFVGGLHHPPCKWGIEVAKTMGDLELETGLRQRPPAPALLGLIDGAGI